jgi:hypothetical protein
MRNGSPVRTGSLVLAAAVLVASTVMPADAGSRRGWRFSHVGAISRNVITPYYVGYYGGHYSYYKPDPIYFVPYIADPDYACWVWPYQGRRFKVC